MTDWIEIVALVGGPVVAVALTLFREEKRQERERKLGVMRQLLWTRSNVGDPGFSVAVNMVPIEFGHVEAVMTTWESFTHAADLHKATNGHVDELVKTMMLDLGYSDRAASQVARANYNSTALVEQRQLNDGVLKGILSVAKSSQISARAAVVLAEHATGVPLELDEKVQ